MKFKTLVLFLYTFFAIGIVVSAQNVREVKKFSDHYYKRVSEFEKETPIKSSDIVFLGNSLTEGGEWSKYFAKTEGLLAKNGGAIRNRGIVGDDAVGMYERLDQILPGSPKKLFLLVGVNDISHNISADSVLKLVDKVVGRILKESPTTKLYMQSLLPINEQKSKYKTMVGKTDTIKNVNIGLEKMAKSYGVKFIQLYKHFTEDNSNQLKPQFTSDGLHINGAGYAIWVNEIKKYVK